MTRRRRRPAARRVLPGGWAGGASLRWWRWRGRLPVSPLAACLPGALRPSLRWRAPVVPELTECPGSANPSAAASPKLAALAPPAIQIDSLRVRARCSSRRVMALS